MLLQCTRRCPVNDKVKAILKNKWGVVAVLVALAGAVGYGAAPADSTEVQAVGLAAGAILGGLLGAYLQGKKKGEDQEASS